MAHRSINSTGLPACLLTTSAQCCWSTNEVRLFSTLRLGQSDRETTTATATPKTRAQTAESDDARGATPRNKNKPQYAQYARHTISNLQLIIDTIAPYCSFFSTPPTENNDHGSNLSPGTRSRDNTTDFPFSLSTRSVLRAILQCTLICRHSSHNSDAIDSMR